MQAAADRTHGHLFFFGFYVCACVCSSWKWIRRRCPRKLVVDSRWDVGPDAHCLSFDHIPARNSRMFGAWGGH